MPSRAPPCSARPATGPATWSTPRRTCLSPQSFADDVKKRVAAAAAKVTVSVLDEKALVKGGFGGILGVGQGSVEPAAARHA